MDPEEHHCVTGEQAITLIVRHLSSQFPRTCSTCGRQFESLRDFFLTTSAIGDAISFDLELGDLRPQDPLGAMAMSNCSCGTTLALTSEGMPLPHLWSVHQWANAEAKSRGIKIAVFLQDARRLTRQRVLGAGADGLPVSR
jgi:hypothetical protein